MRWGRQGAIAALLYKDEAGSCSIPLMENGHEKRRDEFEQLLGGGQADSGIVDIEQLVGRKRKPEGSREGWRERESSCIQEMARAEQ